MIGNIFNWSWDIPPVAYRTNLLWLSRKKPKDSWISRRREEARQSIDRRKGSREGTRSLPEAYVQQAIDKYSRRLEVEFNINNHRRITNG